MPTSRARARHCAATWVVVIAAFGLATWPESDSEGRSSAQRWAAWAIPRPDGAPFRYHATAAGGGACERSDQLATAGGGGALPARHHQGACRGRLQNGRPPRLAAAPEEIESTEETESTEKDLSESAVAQVALFLTYLAAQSSMSFYMKWVLSKVRVTKDLVGIPASFLVTSSQQIVGFLLFILFLIGSRLRGKPYSPKKLANKEMLLVLALSTSFTLNIGLNLLSLSLIPLSLTMIIRGCSPLTTAFMQSVVMKKGNRISVGEWACMLFGVMCATAVVLVTSGGLTGRASFAYFFGVAMAVTSLLSGALDFVFKGILGTNVKLNALDTTFYNAFPAAVLTSLIAAVVSKPVSATWAARFQGQMTDWQVFAQVWKLNPGALGWVFFSGGMAFMYNILTTFMIVLLSPATTAFAGNFNKAATILFSLLVLEKGLSFEPKSCVKLAAVVGNISAFTVYNILRKRRAAAAK